MAQTKLKITIIASLVLISSAKVPVKSESNLAGSHTSLSMLYGALDNYPRADPFKHGIPKNYRSKFFPIKDSSDCKLQETGKIDSVRYFGIQCEGELREGLISFGNQKSIPHIPDGSFKILGKEKIGRKIFVKIVLSPRANKPSLQAKQSNDTEFNYEQISGTKKKKEKSIEKQSDLSSNANLTYFRNIAFDKNRRKLSPSGLEIFFDHTCPLKFLEVDESFYWDNTISFVFEISCVKNSPYAIVRVPGNKKNKLVVSNQEAETPQKGDSFLARLKLRKLSNERAYWEDFKIYYE